MGRRGALTGALLSREQRVPGRDWGCSTVPETPSSVKHVAVEGIKLLLTFSGNSGMQ